MRRGWPSGAVGSLSYGGGMFSFIQYNLNNYKWCNIIYTIVNCNEIQKRMQLIKQG